MPIPSEPPHPEFGWPRIWWMWLMDLLNWCRSKQPIPDAGDFTMSEGPDGLRFKLKPKREAEVGADNPYVMDTTAGDAEATDLWVDGKAYATLADFTNDNPIVADPPWVGVSHLGPRVHVLGYTTEVLVDSNGDTTTVDVFEMKVRARPMIYRPDGTLYKIGPEELQSSSTGYFFG